MYASRTQVRKPGALRPHGGRWLGGYAGSPTSPVGARVACRERAPDLGWCADHRRWSLGTSTAGPRLASSGSACGDVLQRSGGLLAAVLNGTKRQAKGHTAVAAWVQNGPTGFLAGELGSRGRARAAQPQRPVRSGSLLTVVRTPGFYSRCCGLACHHPGRLARCSAEPLPEMDGDVVAGTFADRGSEFGVD